MACFGLRSEPEKSLGGFREHILAGTLLPSLSLFYLSWSLSFFSRNAVIAIVERPSTVHSIRPQVVRCDATLGSQWALLGEFSISMQKRACWDRSIILSDDGR